ncbi:hypothetical protein A2773_06260 [Candidatus Gottesmanbacteria bacterium RIFCSPHIGHO2_01_FULL_39_10]|uniref:DUF4258 domain-containing protein n=1 Tax=Candidatus Gottesmanbacteria bacterium RIFCSPHIGHO2_01_FULL_39_10 TaxID=1798375 RepID=A0A1F5ZME2_9BACT|nr:MAG: hypothetical protein A2773_06260 [Candidatus Gottesmanbacteria bacterium RIFCSPHIGHO2_01_FULL_39_10]
MIIFSDHALEQNKKRKIPKKRIIETVRNPEEILDSFKGRKLTRKQFGNKILEVVTTAEGLNTIIITQYYLGGDYESKIRQKN